eukprot:351479-Chlamydomonas_euryale.AAC.4
MEEAQCLARVEVMGTVARWCSCRSAVQTCARMHTHTAVWHSVPGSDVSAVRPRLSSTLCALRLKGLLAGHFQRLTPA